MMTPEERAGWFDALYIKHYDQMIRIGYRMLGSMAQAEDLVQETFLLALMKLDTLAVHPNPGGWLTVTLHNLVKNERRRASSQEVPLGEMDFPAEDKAEPLEHLLPTNLPEEDRQLLIWRYEYQMKCEEIANRLGISQVACRSRVSRALAKCRTL